MATARELLATRYGLPADASAAAVARALKQRAKPDAAYEAFVAKHFPDVAAAAGFQGQQVRTLGRVAAASYVLPEGVPDAIPISDRPGGPRPATNPPTGDVHRPPQGPAPGPPTDLMGPAVPPASPSTQVTPLGPAPVPLTDQQRHDRRCGYPIAAEPAHSICRRARGPARPTSPEPDV